MPEAIIAPTAESPARHALTIPAEFSKIATICTVGARDLVSLNGSV